MYVSEAFISPKKFLNILKNDPIRAGYEEYHRKREEWLSNFQNKIAEKSEENMQVITDWGNKRLLALNYSSTKLEEMLSLVKEEEKIDMLQLLRYSLIREYSAYKMANKYASDCGEYKKYNFPQKIRLVSKKLSQTIKEFRSNLCNR